MSDWEDEWVVAIKRNFYKTPGDFEKELAAVLRKAKASGMREAASQVERDANRWLTTADCVLSLRAQADEIEKGDWRP